MEILKDWRFWGFIIAVVSFFFSVFNFIVGKIVSTKIRENDLKHVIEDVKILQKESNESKDKLYEEMKKVYRRLGKIEKAIIKRDAICEERHKND